MGVTLIHITQSAWDSWPDDPTALLPAVAAATPVSPPFAAFPDFAYHYHPGLRLYFVVSHKAPLPRLVTIRSAPPPTLTLAAASAAVRRTLTPRPDFPTFTHERDYLRQLRDDLLHSQFAHPLHSTIHTAYAAAIDGIRAEIHALRDRVREEQRHVA